MNLQEISALVEQSITGLNIDLNTARKEKEGQWNITVKGAPVYLDVFNFATKPETYYFQVMSPLFKVPTSRTEELFGDLLDMNFEMYACSICRKNGWLYILSLRPALGLDQTEVNYIIDTVAHYSNDFYSKLTFKYKDVINLNPGAGAPKD